MTQTAARAHGTRHAGAVLAVMCAGMFLVLLDVTAVNVALPDIGSDLHTDVASLQWVVDGYAVAIASLLLAAGTVGDRIGHRRVVVAGFAVFGAASLSCAVAPSAAALVATRVVQGAGAALLLPGTMAVIAEAFPQRAAQAKALGTWAAVSSLALPAGPLLGGALVQASSWRLVFWVNVPVVAGVIVAVRRLVAAAPGRQTGRFDVAGTVCFAVALTGAVFGVIELGHDGGAGTVAAAFVIAAVAAGCGLAAEARHPHPVLPPDLLRAPRFLAPNVVALTMNLVLNGTLFVATLYLQDVRGVSPALAGVYVLPMAAPLVVLAPISGRLTARHGPRRAVAAGCAFGIAGALLLLTARHGIGWLMLAIGITGVGGGLITAAVVAAVVRATPADRAGLATGISNAARQTGTASGVAVFGAVAGSPRHAGAFVHQLTLLAPLGAALWAVALAVALTCVEGDRRGRGDPRGRGDRVPTIRPAPLRSGRTER